MNIDTSKLYCSKQSIDYVPYFYFFEKNREGYNFISVQVVFGILRLNIDKVDEMYGETSIPNTINDSREITLKEAFDYIFEGEE